MGSEKQEEKPEITDLTFDLDNHSMKGIYDYVNFDEEAEVSLGLGVFHVERPHASFYIPAESNSKIDPFPMLEEVTMDEGDVLICSPAKTGTHWSYEIIKMLKAGSAQYTKLPKEAEWIDVSPYERVKNWSPSGTRVLSTHLPLSKLPPNFRRKDTKVIATMRNFKDTAVSAYHHISGIYAKHMPDMESSKLWQTLLKMALFSKKVPYGNHFDVYREFWLESKRDPNVLIVFFEDLKRNTIDEIKRIAAHLGVVCSDSLINEIADAVDIAKMKKGKEESESFYRDQFGKGLSLYRKGEIGDWKNTFTVAENEEFHRVFNEWNKDLQIPFTWE